MNGDHGRDVYRYLRDDLGATFIQYIPIIERASPETLPIADAGWGSHAHGRPAVPAGRVAGHPPVGESGAERPFMIGVFKEWVRRDIGTVYVQMFDTAPANWYGEPGAMCIHAETCGQQLALEHNGDMYSCDHYVEPGCLLGNIKQKRLLELNRAAAPAEVRFGQARHPHAVLPGLRCAGRLQRRCPKDRFATSPLANPASTIYVRTPARSSGTPENPCRP